MQSTTFPSPLLHGPLSVRCLTCSFCHVLLASICPAMPCSVSCCGFCLRPKKTSARVKFGRRNIASTCTILLAGARLRKRLSTSGLGRSSQKPPPVDWPLGPQVLLMLLLLLLLLLVLRQLSFHVVSQPVSRITESGPFR